MQGRGGAGDSGTFTVEQFRANPDQAIDQSVERGQVVIESEPGKVAMVLSVCSFDDLETDDD